jgi:uncharacterized protein YdaU (DUF1376 family)
VRSSVFWFRVTIGDHLRRIHNLTRLQRGALNDLIFSYFSKGSLPIDDDALARICEMSRKEWLQNRDVIKRAGEFMDDWRADWIEAEFVDIANRKDRASNARAKLAEKRAAQPAQPRNNHNGITDTYPVDTSPSPSPSQQKEAANRVESYPKGSTSPLDVELNGEGRGCAREGEADRGEWWTAFDGRRRH